MARGAFWQTGKGQLRRKTVLAKRNVQKAARRAKAYRTVIGSDFHKQLRYAAFLRSGGLCECAECVAIRVPNARVPGGSLEEQRARLERAFTPIPVWFTKTGGEPWRRFRSKHGQLNHLSYKFFGQENPAETEHVEFIWDACHERYESEHSTRRTYLRGSK